MTLTAYDHYLRGFLQKHATYDADWLLPLMKQSIPAGAVVSDEELLPVLETMLRNRGFRAAWKTGDIGVYANCDWKTGRFIAVDEVVYSEDGRILKLSGREFYNEEDNPANHHPRCGWEREAMAKLVRLTPSQARELLGAFAVKLEAYRATKRRPTLEKIDQIGGVRQAARNLSLRDIAAIPRRDWSTSGTFNPCPHAHAVSSIVSELGLKDPDVTAVVVDEHLRHAAGADRYSMPVPVEVVALALEHHIGLRPGDLVKERSDRSSKWERYLLVESIQVQPPKRSEVDWDPQPMTLTGHLFTLVREEGWTYHGRSTIDRDGHRFMLRGGDADDWLAMRQVELGDRAQQQDSRLASEHQRLLDSLESRPLTVS